MSNPLTDDVSFEEFMSRVKSGQETPQKESSKEVQRTMNKADVQKQVRKAELMLKNFVPQQKGGVG